jgi:acid stress-induced BolA-like protein IbaG/YrbA
MAPGADDTVNAIREAIESSIAGAHAEVTPGAAGHYSIVVAAQAFEGLNRVESQRLVYSAIAHLMKGDGAPVHAVDSLKTLVVST